MFCNVIYLIEYVQRKKRNGKTQIDKLNRQYRSNWNAIGNILANLFWRLEQYQRVWKRDVCVKLI